MVNPGEVLDVPELGLRFEFLRTSAETGGELAEFEVVGQPRGFLRTMHVHPVHSERHEVVEGVLKIRMHGTDHVLRAGEALEVPPDTPHSQLPGDDRPGRVRIQVRPAGRVEEFAERLAEMSRNGQLLRSGFPKPLAGAAFFREFAAVGHAARPSLKVQLALATALLKSAEWLRSRQGEYVFVDEWDVAAPPEPVFDALADARSYPQWWRPVYIDVEADDDAPRVGSVNRQHFKGRLPYHVRTRSVTTRLERPHLIEAEVDGDLRGTGIWTLTAHDGATQVRFDWRVHADRALLKALTPILRPALRWNHNWAIARAMEGLEPYAQATARARSAPPSSASARTSA